MKKRVLSMVMAAVMAFSILPLIVFSSFATDDMCGDNLTWSFSNGILTIAGNGDMYDYDYPTDVPWKEYCDQIGEVKFSGEITKIGQYAFNGCELLKSIVLSDDVKNIRYGAFPDDMNAICCSNYSKDIIEYANINNYKYTVKFKYSQNLDTIMYAFVKEGKTVLPPDTSDNTFLSGEWRVDKDYLGTFDFSVPVSETMNSLIEDGSYGKEEKEIVLVAKYKTIIHKLIFLLINLLFNK